MKPEDIQNILGIHASLWGLPRDEEGNIVDLGTGFLKQAYMQLYNYTAGILIGLATTEQAEDLTKLLEETHKQIAKGKEDGSTKKTK